MLWNVLFASLIHLTLSSEVSCPDGTKCFNNKQCCSVAKNRYECCDIWNLLLQEIHVAGREHFLGVPAEFGRNLSHVRHFCKKKTCKGICCDKYCCRHRFAECCLSSHRCCKTGYKCCGNGHWCCQWKQTCSSAHGYCISSASFFSWTNSWLLILTVVFNLLKFFFRMS